MTGHPKCTPAISTYVHTSLHMLIYVLAQSPVHKRSAHSRGHNMPWYHVVHHYLVVIVVATVRSCCCYGLPPSSRRVPPVAAKVTASSIDCLCSLAATHKPIEGQSRNTYSKDMTRATLRHVQVTLAAQFSTCIVVVYKFDISSSPFSQFGDLTAS